jgi:hypothetical protein
VVEGAFYKGVCRHMLIHMAYAFTTVRLQLCFFFGNCYFHNVSMSHYNIVHVFKFSLEVLNYNYQVGQVGRGVFKGEHQTLLLIIYSDMCN